MYRVLICADDQIFAEVLRKRIGTYMEGRAKEYEIEIFTSGIKLLEDIKERMPEVIFLDIDMPEISGMDLADQIFQSDINTNVIFVTNRDDLVFQAIHYQPFRFIRKEKLDTELEEAVGNLVDKLEKDEKILEVQTKDGTIFLPLKKILYIESSKHYLIIRYMGGECETRGKISNFEKWMMNYGFIRTHRSYLVNIRFIKMIRPNEVELDSGEMVPVSRDKLQDVKKRHMAYLRSFTYADY